MKTLLTTSLNPYTGTWGKAQAAHLLRRTTFGASFEQIKEFEILGLETAVEVLLAEIPLPDPPINYRDDDDPWVPLGETWIEKKYPPDGSGHSDRRHAMDAWILGRLISDELNIREKMCLFWHNHFAIERSIVRDGKYIYAYSTLLRQQALGNFRQLVKDITIDQSMLYYLNGRDNTKNNPNENYARELLELFTIGKGDIAGPGDYTTFTEDDVVEIARVLTGWKDRGRYSTSTDIIYSEFRPDKHDTGTKTLSHRFEGAQISQAGEEEYKELINIIFQKEEVAYFICRKLYRWFVNHDITAEVESTIIAGMAQSLIAHDYEVLPVLDLLLKSEHFYSESIRGAIIKNPLEFVFSIFNGFEVEMPEDVFQWYASMKRLSTFLLDMQMSYFYPPSVAGWEAYYIEPLYYKQWINSVTLRPRMEFTDRVSTEGYRFSGYYMQIDVLRFIEKLDNPADPNDLISDISTVIFPEALSQGQVDYLKEILIPGLPDFEWTLEYGLYLENPDDPMAKATIENRLRNMIKAMLTFPEFYTN